MKNSEKKKIVLLANSAWYIYNFRANLIDKIISEDYELFIVTPQDEYVKKLVEAGYNHIEWKLFRKSINPILEIKSLLGLILILKKLNQILYITSTKPCLYGTLSAKYLDIKHVINAITGLGHLFVSKKILQKF